MDAMPLLRSCRDDLPEPEDTRIRAIRARLEARMRAESARPVRGARPLLTRRRGLMLAGAGGALATAVVVGTLTVAPAPSASAEAVRLLRGAATAADGIGDEARTVVTHEQSLSMRQGDDGSIVAAYGDRIVTTLQVPAGDGVWVRTHYSEAPTVFYGGAAARALAAEERADSATAADPVVERSRDGDFTNGELGGGVLFGSDPASLRSLPRDPDALLAALRSADLGAAPAGTQAARVIDAAAMLLRSGAADGDLQGAVFAALQRQPGLDVAGTVDLDGRRGVAIGAPTRSGAFEAQQLILDPVTGAYLGDRSVALVDEGVVPAGAVLSETAVTQR